VDKLFAAGKYLKYRLGAGNAHDVHSPFVFDLLNNVISDHTPFYGFEVIESLRSKHLLDQKAINVNDFGTGRVTRSEKISDIARKALKSKKYSQLLFRLVNHFNCNNILELGTSLGITTLYLALPGRKSRVITLEGSHETAEIARQNFQKLHRSDIVLMTGEFGETLSSALEKMPELDFVFFDGNHKKIPTLAYFEQCLPHSHSDSVFVFDDIHWSHEMEEAWNEIKAHPSVAITIDLYQLGIVLFKDGLKKQHFTLLY
jgi:predicted O-methyltransferase YrrM